MIKSMEDIIAYLKAYQKTPVTLMEVCGSHTAAIAKNGIRTLVSDRIHLVSGPGCPVCVTPSSYVDRLIELAKEENTCVVTFGDLLRVPGSCGSLSQAKGEGANVQMVYAPGDIIGLAEEHPDINYVFAAVGFETTTPVYALLLERLCARKLNNVRLLTALKTMPAAIDWLCANDAKVDGFIAPGHVCAVTGSEIFKPLAEKYQMPFGVAGFAAKELLIAIYGIVRMLENKEVQVKNYYPSVVLEKGNVMAQHKVAKYFEPGDAVWRGMGEISGSGMYLKKAYQQFDAGSADLTQDIKINRACCCDKILTGHMQPAQCPLFKTVCTPNQPQGACMVSAEGSCYQHYLCE